jgi:hypothetical protein
MPWECVAEAITTLEFSRVADAEKKAAEAELNALEVSADDIGEMAH